MLKFFAGFFILLAAFLLQFLFASAGIAANLSFAALISFAFVFEFWELLVFAAAAAFIINWQPAISPALAAYALFPLAAHFLRRFVRWAGWLANAAAILAGFLLLALAISPGALAAHEGSFLVDLAAGEIFGALAFLSLSRTTRARGALFEA